MTPFITSTSPKNVRSNTMKPFQRILYATFITCIIASICVCPAYAIDVTKTTAKPNEDSGLVMGGTPTRITWEAIVSPGEEVTNLCLELPASTDIESSDVRVQTLQGLDNLKVPYNVDVHSDDTTRVDITFENPVVADTLISTQLGNCTLPAQGGTLQISGTYTTSLDEIYTLMPSPTIEYTTTTIPERIAAWLGEMKWVQAWNSQTFLHLFFDPTIIVTSIPQVAKGWVCALGLIACGIPLAIPLGFIFCLMRMSHIAILRAIASVYVNIVRGTPMFLQIYIAFFGLPLLGLVLNNFLLGAIVMAINSGAYLCEIFRVGIQSINPGQYEAARSLGMTRMQTMCYIIIPQAFKRVLPTMTNECILLYKDTSLLAAVGIMETVMYAKVITAATGNITPYIVAALFYLIVTIPLGALTRHMEEETTHPSRKKPSNKRSGHLMRKRNHKPWTPDINPQKDVLAIKTADL